MPPPSALGSSAPSRDAQMRAALGGGLQSRWDALLGWQQAMAQQEFLAAEQERMRALAAQSRDPYAMSGQVRPQGFGEQMLAATGSPAAATAAELLGDPWGFAMSGLEVADEFALGVGDRVLEATGSPAAATAGYLLGDPMNLAAGAGKAATGLGALGGLGWMMGRQVDPRNLSALARAMPGQRGALGTPKPPPVQDKELTALVNRVVRETKKGGGYSVNVPSKKTPEGGLMVGKYRNDDPRNAVLKALTRKDVQAFLAKNRKALDSGDAYLGTWIDRETGTVYLDVSKRFDEDKLRTATKFGERTEQLAGYNVGQGREFPIGNWRDFITTDEFRDRMLEMEGVGQRYLAEHPTPEWWDMHGTIFEDAYGSGHLPQVAGLTAATAPSRNPIQNLEDMSVYMQRVKRGEPMIQPDWRVPDEPGIKRKAGGMVPFERSFVRNLEAAGRGDIASLRKDKVRSEALAMMGDPNAVVLDRHWARLSEVPERGIFANAGEGKIGADATKGGISDYEALSIPVRAAAKEQGRDPRDFSADVWTGIRETIRHQHELYGTKFKKGSVTGESKSYADVLKDLVREKAERLGIDPDEMLKRLDRGDANLLGLALTSPVLYSVFRSRASEPPPEPAGARS